MYKAVVALLFASAGALAPQQAPRSKTVAALEEGRRGFLTQVAGAMVGGLVLAEPAFADGAVSATTQQRARGIYGMRILALKDAVEKGNFAAVAEEKNAFELFNSGAYMTKSPKVKAVKAASIEEYGNIKAAIKAQDKAALKTAYTKFVKNADLESAFPNDIMSGQGYSTEFDWKKGTSKGTIYQR